METTKTVTANTVAKAKRIYARGLKVGERFEWLNEHTGNWESAVFAGMQRSAPYNNGMGEMATFGFNALGGKHGKEMLYSPPDSVVRVVR